jgi:hypothetical protein
LTGTGKWFPDPTGRGERRYWDGGAWTDQISRRGLPATDSISGGYARPADFCFHERNALLTGPPDPSLAATWREIVGRLHGHRRSH